MSKKSMKNKVVIVTGGSGGIGSAIVNKLSKCGARIVSVYNKNHPDDDSNENIVCLKADLTKSEEWDRLLTFTLNKYGKIDVIINCAGVLEPGEFLSLQEDQFRKMIDINFTSGTDWNTENINDYEEARVWTHHQYWFSRWNCSNALLCSLQRYEVCVKRIYFFFSRRIKRNWDKN